MNQMSSPAVLISSPTTQPNAAVLARPVSDHDLHAAALFTLDAVANVIAGRNSARGAMFWSGKTSCPKLQAVQLTKQDYCFCTAGIC
jgi:hypothetical protein